jgi:hypothetical protein
VRRSTAWIEMELAMFDRHWLGDLAVAVALVLPIAGLCLSQPATAHSRQKSKVVTTVAERSPGGRIGLLG